MNQLKKYWWLLLLFLFLFKKKGNASARSSANVTVKPKPEKPFEGGGGKFGGGGASGSWLTDFTDLPTQTPQAPIRLPVQQYEPGVVGIPQDIPSMPSIDGPPIIVEEQQPPVFVPQIEPPRQMNWNDLPAKPVIQDERIAATFADFQSLAEDDCTDCK